ncbi:MAG: cyclic nucleotide-binding domain-containing protein [Chloroflexi bacterium]|nr:cyclic nucleotide-binding domain-containing protein [Chloroflexota bacterium]
MQAVAKESLLQNIPIFARLSDQHLRLIGEALTVRSYRAGEDIFVQGRSADGLLIVLSGAAILFQANAEGSQVPLSTVKPDQFFNQEALFSDYTQSATLRASQNVTIAKLGKNAFDALLNRHSELSAAIGLNTADAGAAINPRFAEQRDDEEVLIETRRHYWAFLRTAWIPLLAMPAMWAAALILGAGALSLLIVLLSLIFPGAALIYFFAEWRNDSVIVTDQRIIRVERTILAMHRQITQVGLESVQEINFEIPPYDPFARLFRYGSVIIKTAGSQGNLELDLIPRPEQFQKLIIEDRQYFESRKAQRHHAMVRDELQRWMAGENPELEQEFKSASADASAPPTPVAGTNGYFSTCIEMSNGDIVYRKHISVWAQHTFIPIVIALLALTGLLLTFTVLSPDLRIVTFPVSMLAFLIGAVMYYWLDWDWRNDIYIISDDTITLVRKRPFFLQNLRDQVLVERIDNVESVTTGFFAAIMKYGDVRMSLIGADEHKLFHKVSNPQLIQQEISRRQHMKEERRARYDAMQQRQILGEYLGAAGAGASQQNAAHSPTSQRTLPPNFADLSPQRDAGAPLLRAANSLDRNRPPRLPKKRLTHLPGATEPDHLQTGDSQRRRPARFRPDRESF